MKIGIITQPLHSNYGGLWQNYALQQVLSKMGHEVYTINKNSYDIYNDVSWFGALKLNVKRFIKKFLGLGYFPTYEERRVIRQHCTEFVKKHISATEMYITQNDLLKIVSEYKFDAYIVGSDQIWRPCFANNIYNDFLDFCQEQKGVKRLAYAASFGVGEWEFSKEQTKECGKLIKLFDAVSVREDVGVKLCREHLGVQPELVLDPTLLLEKKDYVRLIETAGETPSNGNLFCYILDNNSRIESLIPDIERKSSLVSFQVNSAKDNLALKRGDNIANYIIPSPIKWVRAFMDAKMVFTDSFHGCVFSIIFNKPFWVIGNKERGNARFDSLLKMFDLEDRMITLDELHSTELSTEIDWEKVNAIKKEWQQKSLHFIKSNL